jgi:2'-5' RNA ligase
MRLFTAIDIPDEVRARLRSLLDRLRPLAHMRWSPVENLHVTTKFIGEWPEPRLNEVEGALASLPPHGLVEIAVQGLGWFPNPQRPRVFWAGVKGGESLEAVATDTESALAAIGVPVENREFRPHLTLARTREGVSKDSLNALRGAIASLESDDFGSFRAAAHALYLSAGGKYTRLRQFSLLPS